MILVLFTSASVSMAWDFSSAWKSFTNYFSFSPKSYGDYLQRTWNSLTLEQKQLAIAAVALTAASATGYALLPDTKTAALEKAKEHVIKISKDVNQKNIGSNTDIKQVIDLDEWTKQFTKSFPYGFSGNKYIVSPFFDTDTDHKNTLYIDLEDTDGDGSYYIKTLAEQQAWSNNDPAFGGMQYNTDYIQKKSKFLLKKK
jgi:hypothetical protein